MYFHYLPFTWISFAQECCVSSLIEIGPLGLLKWMYKKLLFLEMMEKAHSNEKWSDSGEKIEIVDQFVYQGVLFNFNGKPYVTQKTTGNTGSQSYACS